MKITKALSAYITQVDLKLQPIANGYPVERSGVEAKFCKVCAEMETEPRDVALVISANRGARTEALLEAAPQLRAFAALLTHLYKHQ